MFATDFYDSAKPALIPAGAHACLYYDGAFTPTPAEVKRLGPVRWITVLGGAAAAAHTGCADFEQGNAVFSEENALRAWAMARKAMNCRARVYTDLSNAKSAWERVGDLANVVWWPAIYGPRLTAAQAAARLAEYGAPAAAAKVWGLQYAGGPTAAYDTNALYSVW